MKTETDDEDGIPVEQVAQTMRGMLDAFHALQVEHAGEWAREMLDLIKRECGEDLIAHDPNAEQVLADQYRKWADENRERARVAAIEKFGIEI